MRRFFALQIAAVLYFLVMLGVVLLFGTIGANKESIGAVTKEKAWWTSFVCEKTGTLEELVVRIETTGTTNLKWGIFSCTGVQPNALLTAEQTFSGPFNAPSIKLTGISLAVTAGTRYALAMVPIGTNMKMFVPLTHSQEGSWGKSSAPETMVKVSSVTAWTTTNELVPLSVEWFGTEPATGNKLTMLM